MIKRLRQLVSEPVILSSTKVKKEFSYNCRQSLSINGKFKFSLYKDDEIEKVLETLFYKKCAYCEMQYAVTGDLNIEHFRPKGRVTLTDGSHLSHGYWWLAAEWSNLLPACTRCNQRRKYVINEESISLGKQDYFPLSVPDRLREPPSIINIQNELPLLINPAYEDPMDYIYFENNLEDHTSIAKAKDTSLIIEEKGTASISYYALNRPDLVKSRVKELIRFSGEINTLENYIEELGDTEKFSKKKKYITKVKESLDRIFRVFLEPSEEHLHAKFLYLRYRLALLPTYTEERLLSAIDKINIKIA